MRTRTLTFPDGLDWDTTRDEDFAERKWNELAPFYTAGVRLADDGGYVGTYAWGDEGECWRSLVTFGDPADALKDALRAAHDAIMYHVTDALTQADEARTEALIERDDERRLNA